MKKNKILKYILMFGLIILLIYIISKFNINRRHISARKIKHYVEGYGNLSFIVLMLIYAIKPFVMIFPTWTLGVVSGAIYGSFWGFFVSLVGCFISATVGYYVAKFLGRDFVVKFIGGKFNHIDQTLKKDGFKILLLMRLPVIFPYDALSLACGLTSIKYRDFILASVLGVMPEMFAYNFFGNSMGNDCYKQIYIPITIMVILILFSMYIKYRNQNK